MFKTGLPKKDQLKVALLKFVKSDLDPSNWS